MTSSDYSSKKNKLFLREKKIIKLEKKLNKLNPKF